MTQHLVGLVRLSSAASAAILTVGGGEVFVSCAAREEAYLCFYGVAC